MTNHWIGQLIYYGQATNIQHDGNFWFLLLYSSHQPYTLLSICKHHYFCFSLLILTKTNPDLNTKQIVLVTLTRYFIKLQRDPHVWLSRCHLQSCNVWQTATQTDNRSPAHVYLGQSYLQLSCLTFMQISTHRFYSDILHDFSKQSTKIVTILTFRR